MFTLSFLDSAVPRAHRLRDGETVIGRAPTCDLVLSSPLMSRQHARVRVAGGPSPFGAESLRLLHGGDTLRLLQVGVQARDLELLKRQPVHLTMAVDVSASMAWEGRLEAIVQALGALVGLLQPDDRLSIVTFSERAEVLLVWRGLAETPRSMRVEPQLDESPDPRLGP